MPTAEPCRVVAVLLAAGSSRRFGEDKLAATHRGLPLFEHALGALLASPEIGSTVAVVKPGSSLASPRPGCTWVENPDHAEGMGASLRAGVRAAPADADAYLVALADMPGVTPRLVAELVGAFRASGLDFLVPVHRGRRGHPVLLSARHRAALLEVGGDVGARELLASSPDRVCWHPTEDPAVVLDVDSPADLAGAP